MIFINDLLLVISNVYERRGIFYQRVGYPVNAVDVMAPQRGEQLKGKKGFFCFINQIDDPHNCELRLRERYSQSG
jgi:hypothetical protein